MIQTHLQKLSMKVHTLPLLLNLVMFYQVLLELLQFMLKSGLTKILLLEHHRIQLEFLVYPLQRQEDSYQYRIRLLELKAHYLTIFKLQEPLFLKCQCHFLSNYQLLTYNQGDSSSLATVKLSLNYSLINNSDQNGHMEQNFADYGEYFEFLAKQSAARFGETKLVTSFDSTKNYGSTHAPTVFLNANFELIDDVIETRLAEQILDEDLNFNLGKGFESTSSINGLFFADLGVDGLSSLNLNISSYSYSGTEGLFGDGRGEGRGISSAAAFIDPFFAIDPSYLELNPNTSLRFTLGVGNESAISAVPAPAAVWLFASGLPFLFNFRKGAKR